MPEDSPRPWDTKKARHWEGGAGTVGQPRKLAVPVDGPGRRRVQFTKNEQSSDQAEDRSGGPP